MFEFFGSVVGALASAAPDINDLGGQRPLDLAGSALDRFRQRTAASDPPAAAREELARAAAMSGEAFAGAAEAAVERALPGKPPEYRRAVAEYLKLIPGRIRAAFARPEDPAGTTAPAGWAARRPEDLVPLLPPRLPRLREGDAPAEASSWVLAERLGLDTFGETWKARNRAMKNTFSVFKFCLDPAALGLLLGQQQVAIEQVQSVLADHPNVVPLHAVHLQGPTPWVQYEYVPDGDLRRLLAGWPSDPAERAPLAVDALRTITSAAAAAHRLSPAVVHRDLKPESVLVARDGRLKVADYGISGVLAGLTIEEARVAAVGHLTGRPAGWARPPLYASPQQVQGLAPTPSDDVHALGVLLYQLLVGDLGAVPGRDFRDDLQEMRVCPELLDVVSQSIACRASRRYPDAGELSAALGRLPAELMSRPAAPPPAEADLDRRIDARFADADAKNAEAERLCDSRQWNAAMMVLHRIRHPRMRRADLVARAEAFRQGRRFVNPFGMEFARVPKGTFWVGGGGGVSGDRRVTITEDFYIAVYPVTQEEWQRVTGDNPSYFQKGGKGAAELAGVPAADVARFPVERVSWYQCQDFVGRINEMVPEDEWVYRLPRDGEWEYACRGAATTQHGCSWRYYLDVPTNTLSPHQANFAETHLGRPTKVGMYPANALGLHDMHGNVWEWCEDSHGNMKRVSRGGGWLNSADYCQASYRDADDPAYSYYDLGLRLVRVPRR